MSFFEQTSCLSLAYSCSNLSFDGPVDKYVTPTDNPRLYTGSRVFMPCTTLPLIDEWYSL